jgi:hypothetical protein
MSYKGMAWPGLQLSIKAVNRDRAKLQRTIKLVQEQPALFKRPKSVLMRNKAMLADLDTGLKVLRDAARAVEAPAKRTRQRSDSA